MNFPFEVKKFNETLVIFKDGNKIRSVEIGCKIQQFIVSEPSYTIFVLTEPPVSEEGKENLFCIDIVTGKINWRKLASKSRSVSNVFTCIELNSQDHRLTVWDWDGYRYVFDSITGKEIESHFFK